MRATNKFNKGAQAASTASPPEPSPVPPITARSNAKPDSLAIPESGRLDDIGQVVSHPNSVEIRYWDWKQSIPELTHRTSSIVADWSD